ncbi:MAG: helix-turn-helix domain-containing protein [Candidatus Krumholzibacteriia bacterium]
MKARLLAEFETLLEEATRCGRPPRQSEPEDESAVLRELLALVPREVWTRLPRDRRQALVAAQERLNRERALTQAQFCELLGVSERTFRSWKQKKNELPPPAGACGDSETEDGDGNGGDESNRKKNKKKRRSKSTGRFDLTATLPGNQLVADTSKWELFGVPLYIVGVQDPGWRKQRLWESFDVDAREDSELIVRTVSAVLQPGMQFVCDQGTPYMSEFTREAIESWECEHAPQKEGAPTEKATKERAFRTVKEALAPLTELSSRIAELVPALRDAEFVRAVGRRLLSCFLRVYEAAPREGGHPLEGRSAGELEAIAQQQREKARAETRSVRLTLAAIHRQYRLPGGAERFIRAHRQHALEDLQEAERRLRRSADRSKINDFERYFAGIVRNVREENAPKRERKRRERKRLAEEQRALLRKRKEAEDRRALLRDRPEVVLVEGLDMVNVQWRPHDGTLFLGGRGLGRARIRDALRSMRGQNEYTVRDRAQAVWTSWAASHDNEAARTDAVRAVFDALLAESTSDVADAPRASEILEPKAI